MATTYVAVLYSIILGNGKRLVMSDLKAMAEDLGLIEPRTILATGNMVFEVRGTTVAKLEKRLEDAFAKKFGKRVPIIVRTAKDWQKLVEGNPFPRESEKDPGNVMVRIMRDRFDKDQLPELRKLGKNGERVDIVDGDFWAYFPNGAAGSRVMPVLDPKRYGVGTSRGWNTVRKLGEMLSR